MMPRACTLGWWTILWFNCLAYSNLLQFLERMIDQDSKGSIFCRNVFVIIYRTSVMESDLSRRHIKSMLTVDYYCHD